MLALGCVIFSFIDFDAPDITKSQWWSMVLAVLPWWKILSLVSCWLFSDYMGGEFKSTWGWWKRRAVEVLENILTWLFLQAAYISPSPDPTCGNKWGFTGFVVVISSSYRDKTQFRNTLNMETYIITVTVFFTSVNKFFVIFFTVTRLLSLRNSLLKEIMLDYS